MRTANGSKGSAGTGGTDAGRGHAGGGSSVRTVLPSVVAVVILIILVPACNGNGDGSAAAAPDGTEEFEVEGANHVAGDVQYSQTPPVGGDHDPAWQNCGSYREPVREENALHSLEHGAVWHRRVRACLSAGVAEPRGWRQLLGRNRRATVSAS